MRARYYTMNFIKTNNDQVLSCFPARLSLRVRIPPYFWNYILILNSERNFFFFEFRNYGHFYGNFLVVEKKCLYFFNDITYTINSAIVLLKGHKIYYLFPQDFPIVQDIFSSSKIIKIENI